MNFRKLSSFLLFFVLVLVFSVGIGPAGAGATDGFTVIADFEAGLPGGFAGFADSWDGSGSSTTLAMSTANVALPTVPSSAGNTILSVDYDIAASGSWGGGPGYLDF